MTTTYDPFHPKYFDEADLRQEMDRVHDLCHGCRLCIGFCTSFPTLFEYIDLHDDQDSSKMTPEQQDQVVDECFQCKLCYVNCPYIPGQHEWEIDFPRLMMRAEQVLEANRKQSVRTKLTNYALGSTDKVGTLSSAMAPLVNKVIGSRLLAPYTKQRFSTWFNRPDRPETSVTVSNRQGRAILFPTCMVEYQNTDIGKDAVKVYERNGIRCDLPDGEVCCGAPFLHQGDLERFRKLANENVEVLADAIRTAKAEGDDDVVVAVCQPTCGYVLKYDYRDYVPGPDAQLVAVHTRDVAEYLVDVHRGDDTELDIDFGGDVPETTTYHAPCHLRAQNLGMRSRVLLELTGTKVTLVAECSAMNGTWGLLEENAEVLREVAQKMVKAIETADSEAVAGDCTLANGGIVRETGHQPRHPIQQVARAYGIPED